MTILCSLILMAGMFLMLYAGVGFIQNNSTIVIGMHSTTRLMDNKLPETGKNKLQPELA